MLAEDGGYDNKCGRVSTQNKANAKKNQISVKAEVNQIERRKKDITRRKGKIKQVTIPMLVTALPIEIAVACLQRAACPQVALARPASWQPMSFADETRRRYAPAPIQVL